MNLFDLTGTTAVVIGGNGVLGSAMCLGLAEHGARIVVVGRNAEKVDLACKRIVEVGGDAFGIAADATHKEDMARVLAATLEWSGRVDVLVNAAGINSSTNFFDVSMEEFDRIMSVNLKSVVLSCQIIGKHMVESGEGGSIINISSVSSDPPLSRVFTYSASKAGVNSVTKYLAREFAPSGVRVNAIIPGFFPAEQNRKILTKERVQSILDHTPVGRFGEAEELQGTVVWLASPKASGFVTGALVRVDGGFGAVTI